MTTDGSLGDFAMTLDGLMDDFEIQAELDVRGTGMADPEAVDLGMKFWRMGLRVGIGYAHGMLDEWEARPVECARCLKLWPPEVFPSGCSKCPECRTVASWFRRRAVCRLIRRTVGR